MSKIDREKLKELIKEQGFFSIKYCDYGTSSRLLPYPGANRKKRRPEVSPLLFTKRKYKNDRRISPSTNVESITLPN